MSDLLKWEKEISAKEKLLKEAKERKRSAPPRQGSGTVQVTSAAALPTKSQSAARHTYDLGYKKWEQFDPDAVPAENDSSVQPEPPATHQAQLTPATMIDAHSSASAVDGSYRVPRARGTATAADAELAERERGNAEFNGGNFAAAVKIYTKCIGMKSRNYIAFSNRAMALLKLKEYVKAESDCSCALAIEPNHVKSLQRRATARNALGKHRAAVQDLLLAEQLEESSKPIKADLAKAREQLRSAVSRAPLVRIQAEWDEAAAPSSEDTPPVQGPDMPSSALLSSSSSLSVPSANPTHEQGTHSPVDSAALPPAPRRPQQPPPTAIPAAISPIESGGGSSSASVPKKTKKDPSGRLSTSYDLERSLRMYASNETALEKYVCSLQLSEAVGVLSSLKDADVMAALLAAVLRFQGRKYNRWDEVVGWLEAVSRLPNFSLLESLMAREDKDRLSEGLTYAAEGPLLAGNAGELEEDRRSIIRDKFSRLRAIYKLDS